jgi:hypothetical protein
VAAFAWAAFGFGILMVVSYRPNRYVVPLVPSLAILAAIGLHLFIGWLRERLAARESEDERAGEETRTGRAVRARRLAPNLIVTAAIVVAVAPGLAWYGNWARHATYDLVAIQNQFADAVPPGEMVAGGDSALFLMQSRAKTVVVGLNTNEGNLYAQGARWYLLASDAANPNDAAIPTGVPEAVWATRDRVMCASWRGGTECLFHVR